MPLGDLAISDLQCFQFSLRCDNLCSTIFKCALKSQLTYLRIFNYYLQLMIHNLELNAQWTGVSLQRRHNLISATFQHLESPSKFVLASLLSESASCPSASTNSSGLYLELGYSNDFPWSTQYDGALPTSSIKITTCYFSDIVQIVWKGLVRLEVLRLGVKVYKGMNNNLKCEIKHTIDTGNICLLHQAFKRDHNGVHNKLKLFDDIQCLGDIVFSLNR